MVASGNGLRAVEKAMELVKKGHDPLDAAIEGVAIVEADPKDHSVGYGGLPNEDGVVELDAAVMHGPTHGGGSVASIRNIMHPAAVARLVMQRTRHCLLVGEGALRFARAHGFPEVNLLTDEAAADLAALERDPRPQGRLAPAAGREGGRIHPRGTRQRASPARSTARCSTPTATWAARRRPRACRGRSPAASAIRRSWAPGCTSTTRSARPARPASARLNLLNLSSCSDRRGHAARAAAQGRDHGGLQDDRHDQCTRDPKRRRPDGQLAGNVSFYAVNKDGKFAGGSIYPGGKMAVHDGDSARVIPCEPLYEK